jgi:hypothetical protein
MATPKHGKVHRLYYDYIPVSAFANSDVLTITLDAAEYTAFEDAAKVFKAGKYSGTSNFAGFLDVADGGFGDVQHADLADGNHWIGRLWNGTGIGSLAYETVEVSTGNSIAADVANVVAMTWNGQGAARLGRGCQLTAGAASITATGAQTGVNYGSVWQTVGAASTQVVTARVVAVSGTGSISIQLEESTDDGSGDAYAQVTGWTSTEVDPGTNVNIGTADTLTFTGIGAAKMTRTGAIEAWQRVNVTAYSTFTSVTLLVTTVTLA